MIAAEQLYDLSRELSPEVFSKVLDFAMDLRQKDLGIKATDPLTLLQLKGAGMHQRHPFCLS